LGSPVGLALGAYLFKNGGYLCVFGTSVVLHLIAVVYTAFVLPEVPQPKPAQYTVGKHGWYGTWDNDFASGSKPKRIRYYSEFDSADGNGQESSPAADSVWNSSSNVENNLLLPPTPSRQGQGQSQNQYRTYAAPEDDISEEEGDISVIGFIMGSMKSIVKKRPGHTRKCLLSLGLIMLLYGITYHGAGKKVDFPSTFDSNLYFLTISVIFGFPGEINMKYLFTRNRFNWREQQFSTWVIFEALMVVTGLFVVLPVFSKLFKFSDPFSGILAALGRLVSRLFYAFAPNSAYLYVGKQG
jgi:hypothetical protein